MERLPHRQLRRHPCCGHHRTCTGNHGPRPGHHDDARSGCRRSRERWPAPAGNAVFPDKIAPKYGSLKAGTARRKTCDDQYKLNKANAGNAGLPWNQKGGGYYSACNKHLKGV